MRFKKLIITNIGKHRRLELNLKHGLIGVVGKNGSGKSTITDSMFALLTNDWTRFPGLKEDSISNLAGPKDESSVYGELEHNGTDFQLYRALRAPRGTPAHSLRVDGKEITKAPDIQVELERRLGINKSLIGQYVFVRQWDMFSFLSQTPGERAATYQLLCGTGKAEKIHAAIGKLLEQDACLFAGVTDNSDDIRHQLAAVNALLAKAAEDRKTAGTGLLAAEKVTLAESYLRKRENFNRIAPQQQELLRRLAEREPQLSQLRNSCESLQRLQAEAEELVASLKVQADAARGGMAQLQQYKTTAANRARFEAQLVKLEAALAAREAVLPHPRENELPALEQEYADLHADYRRNVDILRTFENSGVVECPTCGTPVTDLDHHLKNIRQTVADQKPRLASLSTLLTIIRQQRARVLDYDKWLTEQQNLIASVTGQLAGLAVSKPPVTDEQAMKQAIDDYNEQAINLGNIQNRCNNEKVQLARLEAGQQADRQQADRNEAELAANAIEDARLDSAKKALERHQAARLRLATADGQIKELKASIARLEEELATMQARVARGAKAISLGNRLRQMRDEVFHRTKLPQAVAQTNLQSMEGDIADVLADFGSPFHVKTTDNLSFTVKFPGEPEMAAERLSGGLRGVLAVAFRFAVARVFGADLGLMSLDEPTAGFDADNVQFLADAMTRYASQVRDRRQVFLITHSPGLRSAFDQVIDLTPV